MELLFLCSPPVIWFLSKDSFPRVSKLSGFISLLIITVLLLNTINSM